MTILEFWPRSRKESLRTFVREDARKGMWRAFLSFMDLIHSFRQRRDLLISAPSKRRPLQFDWQSCALSLP